MERTVISELGTPYVRVFTVLTIDGIWTYPASPINKAVRISVGRFSGTPLRISDAGRNTVSFLKILAW